MAGICMVARESMKHAASRPRPPLPSPASGSCSNTCARSIFSRSANSWMSGSIMRLLILLGSDRPMSHSIDR